MPQIVTTAIVDAIRLFWLQDFHEINGMPRKGFSAWILDEAFQIYAPPKHDSFEMHFADATSILSSFAFDCTRMAQASIESVNLVYQNPTSTKSTAWPFIQVYYAAFYAAHALLRTLGISCTQLTSKEIGAVSKVSVLYGQNSARKPHSGFYRCEINSANSKVVCLRTSIATGGSHETFWSVFCYKLREMATAILSVNISAIDKVVINSKLRELCENLAFGQCADGGWLSFVRNEVCYRHRYGCWYPFSTFSDDNFAIFNIASLVDKDPLNICLSPHFTTDQRRFVNTCAFIISLCLHTLIDMSQRCTTGKSFHQNGVISLLNHFRK